MRFIALGAVLLMPALAGADITFHEHVLPILQKRCQSCHRPGEAGPMALLTYNDARPWAKSIRQAVLGRKMPPWFADAAYGKFSNNRSLTEAEIRTLTGWVDAGAPEGDRNRAPEPVEWVEGWTIGKPDAVFEMPVDFTVPASGTVDYQHFVIPTRFTEDRWIQAVEVRPGNRAVLHHAVAFVRPPGSRWIQDARPGEPYVPKGRWQIGLGIYDEVLDTYVPGAIPHRLEPGQAKLIPKGSDLILQTHYTANGKAATDRSKIGIIFAKAPPRERIYSMNIANTRIIIPPGAPAHPAEAKAVIQHDTKVVAMSPHMHVRGRSMTYRAVYPTGESKVLLNVPNYDFNWQLFYYLEEPVTIPRGTRIEINATFDNSANNPRNPDPSQEVRWGDQSWQEMLVAFIDLAVAPDLDPIHLYRPAPPARAGAE